MPGEPEMERSSIGVVTVDDHEAFRRSIRDVIEATPGFELLGEAASGEAALTLVADLTPELVLVDARMPGMDGFETARRLRSVHPAATVVLVSSDDVAESVCDSCGAAAFVSKREFGRATLRRIWDEHGAPSIASSG
jgi:two-component system, NarL family, invasion response regulator UvrY